MKYVKSLTLDIHGGGQDLIFPHHENEVAQSEGYTGETFVNYWMHNGFITVNKEKMSKSLGNFFLVRDILKKFPGEILRYFILSAHYRSPIDFNVQALKESEKSLLKLMNVYEMLQVKINKCKNGENNKEDTLLKSFTELEASIEKALQDDFNTSLAISYFFDGKKIIAKAIDAGRYSLEGLKKAYNIYDKYLNNIFSFLPYRKLKKEANVINKGDLSQDIETLIKIRNIARSEKNYKYSDLIRDELNDMDIEIIDTKEGTTWKKR